MNNSTTKLNNNEINDNKIKNFYTNTLEMFRNIEEVKYNDRCLCFCPKCGKEHLSIVKEIKNKTDYTYNEDETQIKPLTRVKASIIRMKCYSTDKTFTVYPEDSRPRTPYTMTIVKQILTMYYILGFPVMEILRRLRMSSSTYTRIIKKYKEQKDELKELLVVGEAPDKDIILVLNKFNNFSRQFLIKFKHYFLTPKWGFG
jgi:transposase-like protein